MNLFTSMFKFPFPGIRGCITVNGSTPFGRL